MEKQRHCDGRKRMIIYSNNMIDQKITSNVISDPNEWYHSYVGINHRKNLTIRINNGYGETTTSYWEKTNDDI